MEVVKISLWIMLTQHLTTQDAAARSMWYVCSVKICGYPCAVFM